MCEVERKLQDLENNTYFRIGKIGEVRENQKANKKNLVGLIFLAGFSTRIEKK